jgi:hypothetical protein
MALFIDVRSWPDVQRLVQVVAALNPYAGFGDVPAALGRFDGGPFGYQVFPRSPPTPSWLWMDTGNQVVVASAGVSTVQDGLAVLSSTLQPLVRVGSWSSTSAQIDAARLMLASLGDRFARGPRSWVLAGHSYGGSILCVLAALLADAGVVSDLQLCSFGAPRPGDNALSLILARYTVRRYQNSDDPVPRFPPHLVEAPAATLAAPFPVAVAWSLFVQPQGGVVLWPDGVVQTRQLPPSVLPIADAQLLGWALSDRGFFSTGHRIAEYQFRVAEATAAAAAFPPALTTGTGPEPTDPLTAQQLQAASTGGVASTSPIGGIVMSQGYIPPQFRAKAVKTGPLFYRVQWMGNNVLTGTSRSNARSLARGINGWLRRMQGAAFADHTAFNASLAAYWLVCVSSSQGFNPPLVVT